MRARAFTRGRCAIGAAAVAVAIAGCSSSGAPLPLTASHVSVAESSARGEPAYDLFVTSLGPTNFAPDGYIGVYGLARGEFRNYLRGGVDKPAATAFDSKGVLYVANTAPYQSKDDIGSVSAFYEGSDYRQLYATVYPDALAVDKANNVYVANKYAPQASKKPCALGSVGVYRPANGEPVFTIDRYVNRPTALAHDDAGNLYVANDLTVKGSCRAGDSVTIFRPHSAVPVATLNRGVFHPRALVLYSQLLYVANAPPRASKKLPLGSVTVYNTRSFKLVRTITDGIATPVALATDSGGRLFVANLNGPSVTVYDPGSNGRPSRIIRQGVTSPRALAIGSDYGDLYVANVLEGTVSAYYAGSNTPRLTISGLVRPISLALGPYF